MSERKKAVYFFCRDSLDPVAGPVFQAVSQLFHLDETGIVVDASPVLVRRDEAGNEFYYVQTDKVLSHDYGQYLPMLNRHFSHCDVAGIVTWHAGQNSPDAILTVHTTGDVNTGNFGAANPAYMRNLLLALEEHRREEGLSGYRVTAEATHWSGMVYGGGSPDMISQFAVPMLDIEIGSSPECWSNVAAASALARSLAHVFSGDGKRLRNLLCAGGVHFEPAFAEAVFQTWGDCAFGVSHVLANQWLIAGQYEGETGLAKLEVCVNSIRDGIEAIAFHDNLKGAYKDQLRTLGRKLDVPVLKHQALRRPEAIPWRRD